MKLFFDRFPLFLALVAGIIKFRHLNKGLRFLFYQLCFANFVEAAILVNRLTIQANNLPGLHIYTPVEFFFYGMLYSYYLKELIKPRYIYIVIALFVTFSVINSLFIQSIYEFNNYVRAIEGMLLIVFAILYFYKVLMEMKIPKLSKEPMIWINSAVLFFFSGNFFVFALSNLALKYSHSFSTQSWYFHSLINFLLYVLIARGLMLVPKSKK